MRKPKSYQVKVVETLTYYIDVEAYDEADAENAALTSDEFTGNLFTDNDSEVVEVVQISKQ